MSNQPLTHQEICDALRAYNCTPHQWAAAYDKLFVIPREEGIAFLARLGLRQSWEMAPEATERNAKFAAFANSAQGRAQERVCIKRALRAAGVEIPASILGDAAALRELADARGVTPYTWDQVKARNAHFAAVAAVQDIDSALYGLPQDSEIGPEVYPAPEELASPAGWDVAEPGPEQVPQHLRGHVAALSPTYWTQLAKLPGHENSGTRANEYETLVALGVAERKVEPIFFDNGQPRGSHLFFRLAEREARP